MNDITDSSLAENSCAMLFPSGNEIFKKDDIFVVVKQLTLLKHQMKLSII